MLHNGIFWSLLASFFVVLSYTMQQRGNIKLSLCCILLCGFCLRIFMFSDSFLHEWDERYHFLVAKNLQNDWLKPILYPDVPLHYAYQNWTANYIWMHKPPFTLWCIMLSFKCFGVSEFSGRIPSLIFSLFCIFLTYKIALHLFKNHTVALLSAFFHSINGLVLDMASGRAASEHIDTTLFFIVELAVYLILLFEQKKKWYLIVFIGVLTGLAVLTKWYVGLIIVPLFWIYNISFDKKYSVTLLSFVIFAIAIVVFHPWQYYIKAHFLQEAAWESQYNIRHIFEAIEGHGHEWWYHLDKARIVWNEAIYIVFIWFLLQFYNDFFNKKNLLLAVWVAIPYFIFSCTATKMPGYVLFTAPVFFMLLAAFIVFCKENQAQHKFLKYVPIIIVALSIRYAVERVKPLRNDIVFSSKKQKILDYEKQLGNGKYVVFNTQNSIETMFYTSNLAYEKMPNQEDIALLKEKNYSIAIIDDGNLPDFIKNNELVKKLPFIK